MDLIGPLVNERREGQVRWRALKNGTTNLALRLSYSLLMALVLSRRLMSPLEGTEVKASLDSSLDTAAAMISARALR